jgi:hypothetical protein
VRYRLPREFKRGRVFASASLRNLCLPRVYLYVDGESVTLGASFGTDGCDPALMLDLDLSRTKLGRALAAVYWRVDDRRARRVTGGRR